MFDNEKRLFPDGAIVRDSHHLAEILVNLRHVTSGGI